MLRVPINRSSVQPVEIVVSYIKQSRRNGKLEDVTEFTIEVDNSRTLGEAIFDVLPDEVSKAGD